MTMRFTSRPFIIGAAATALASCMAGYVWFEQHRPAILEVYVFSLKSGRSMFIRTPDDRRILVDGGGNSQVIQRLTDIIPFYSRRIDAIIITNTEGKNASGLIDVIGRYRVDRIYTPLYTSEGLGIASSTDQIYRSFLEAVKEKKIPIEHVSAGDTIPLEGQATARIVFPEKPDVFPYSKASAPEVLFSISYKRTSILFLGDASKKVQKFVASSSASVVADVAALIISQSAAPANMSLELMRTAQPPYLIYKKTETKASFSKKSLNDPLAAILKEHRFNIKDGSMRIVSDGEQVEVKKAP